MDELKEENGMRKFLSKDANEILKQYRWPGNVRELNNIISKMYYMSDGDEITAFHIPKHIRYAEHVPVTDMSAGESMDSMVEELEKHLVVETLKKTGNNITKTADILKISRPRLYRIMKKLMPEDLC